MAGTLLTLEMVILPLTFQKAAHWNGGFNAKTIKSVACNVAFYTYIVQNGWWELRTKQKTPDGYFAVAKELQ